MIASYSNHSRTYIFMTEIDLQIQRFIIEQWDRTSREWLSHAQTSSRVFATWVVNPSIFSSFSLVGGLGEITCKKQTWSNAKAFRVIDRAADVLQIDQVPAISGIRVSLATNMLSVSGKNQQRPCMRTEDILLVLNKCREA